MLLKYHDPSKLRTGNVVFQELVHSVDANSLELLRDLTATRRHLEDALSGIRPSEAIAREHHGGITERSLQDLRIMEKYLPLLENLLHFAKPGVKTSWWQKKFLWSSPLSWGAAENKNPYLYGCNDLRYEHAMILTLYATLMRERAMVEIDRAPTEAIRRLRQAAGIYQYLSSEVLGELLSVFPNVSDRPVEVAPHMALAWTHICLGEAQAIAVQIKEKDGTLPGRIPSLHRGCSDLFENAMQLIEVHKKEWKELSEKFLRYLRVSKALHDLKMRRSFAELVTKEEKDIGKVVCILREAEAKLQLVKVPGDEEWRAIFMQEVEAFNKQCKTALYDNENIYRHKEPHEVELPPSLKLVERAIPYEKTTPLRDFHFS